MKAIVQRAYGSPDLLELQAVDKPVVKEREVLIRVHASSVNRADWIMVTGRPHIVRLMGFGLFKPKHRIPGLDVAGRVEAVGSKVTLVQPGDEVYGDLFEAGLGAYAEYVSVPEDKVAPKPANLSFEQAATVPLAGATALQGLRDMRTLRPGERVLIVGAAGGVGSFAVQIARAFGAKVTGVCSPKSVDLVRSIGAHHVIDYTRTDFTRTSARYDLVFDLVGNRSVPDLLRVLAPSGTLVMSSGNTDSPIGPLGRMLVALAIRPFVRPKIRVLSAMTKRADLIALKELIEAGSVTPVIDRRYTLDQVPDAIRYHGEGHARGKTVIAVETRGEPERAYVPAVVATAASSAAV